MIGLTNLWINGRAVMQPELNVKRAVFVLGKIDEILAWDKSQNHERDLRFVDLGRYLCEVRAGQYYDHCTHLGMDVAEDVRNSFAIEVDCAR